MLVREATPSEYEDAGRVTADAYREFFDEGARDEHLDYLERLADVAERATRTTILIAVDEDEQIVGSLTLELDGRVNPDGEPLPPERAGIRMLGVSPAARARGAARALMADAEARARAAGRIEMRLHTTDMMVAAQRMYEKLGYQRLPDEVQPDGFVLLSYRKAL
jgi:ribosomal protein S18 acetylase RimI-like enzyme